MSVIIPDSDVTKKPVYTEHSSSTGSPLPRHKHVSPVLQPLHWFPMRQPAIFKILLITYKAQHQLALQYIPELITRMSVWIVLVLHIK